MIANRLSFRIALAGAFAVTLFTADLPAAEPGKKPFRAGAYAMDITPQKFPISVNGGMQDRLGHRGPRPAARPLPGAGRRHDPAGHRRLR